MSRSRLSRSIPLRDGQTLATIEDARAYMLALPQDRALRNSWQRVARLMLDGASVEAITAQLEGALFLDVQLDLRRRRESP